MKDYWRIFVAQLVLGFGVVGGIGVVAFICFPNINEVFGALLGMVAGLIGYGLGTLVGSSWDRRVNR